MLILIIISVYSLFSISVSAEGCNPVDFNKGSIVCACNSTYCDFYPDPIPPENGEFIWYVTSKSGERLKRIDGNISREPINDIKIKINSTKEFQTIEGFGGAFTDSAGINIKNLSQASQDNLMRSYFSSNGSKYNFGRVPIAGTDFSTRAYSYDDVDGDVELKNFTLAEEDYKYKIPLLKQAQELNPSLRLVSAAWTAPPWMKNHHRYNGFSYLLEKYYQTYANYIIKFLEEYKKFGLEIWAVSTGNEPFTGLLPISHINTMFWTSKSASNWVINNLGPTVQKSNSNSTYILMLDDQRINLPWYMRDVKNNHPEALNYVKGIAVHWYTDAFIPASTLDKTHDLLPDKFILMTEACIGDRPWETEKVMLGSWDRAQRIIVKEFENINHWVVGWIDWNLALNLEGGPNWVNNNVDAPVIVDAEKDIFYKQPMYYALTHFSKFVPASSVRIETTSDDSDVLSTAFKTKENQIITVLYNKSDKKKNVSITDDSVGSINIELLEYSLHTILYKNV